MKRLIWIVLAVCWMFTTTDASFTPPVKPRWESAPASSPSPVRGWRTRHMRPGSTYIFLPFINDWHTFDTKLQNLEMVFERAPR